MQWWVNNKQGIGVRILLVNYRYFISGGPERYMFNVKELLESKGHEVIPFSIKSKRNQQSNYEMYFAEPLGGQDEAYFDRAKISARFIMDVISRLFYSFHVKNRVKRIIDETKPEVAYVLHHYNKLSPSVIDACKEKGLKVYVRLSDFFLLCPQAHFLRHGEICERCIDNGLFEAIASRCVKDSYIGSALKAISLYFHSKIMRCYRRVDGFICTTKFMSEKMKLGGWPASLMNVIPTFIPRISDVNPELFQENKIKYILYFGRFTHEKGIDVLINAYYKSQLNAMGVKLVLVGGALTENIGINIQILEELREDIIVYRFISTNELGPLIGGCLFTVMPSRWYENLPNTILESYQYLKPVISSDAGSLPEIVKDNKTGMLFKNADTDDLSTKLRTLVLDDDLRNRMKEEIKNTLNIYSPDFHYESLLRVMSK